MSLSQHLILYLIFNHQWNRRIEWGLYCYEVNNAIPFKYILPQNKGFDNLII